MYHNSHQLDEKFSLGNRGMPVQEITNFFPFHSEGPYVEGNACLVRQFWENAMPWQVTSHNRYSTSTLLPNRHTINLFLNTYVLPTKWYSSHS